MNRLLLVVVLVFLAAQPVLAARAKIDTRSADPYLSALVVDADTGTILVDETDGALCHPRQDRAGEYAARGNGSGYH